MAGHDAHDASAWDERYTAVAGTARVWSGRPNGVLLAEVADLPPGTALDVGCGEGADAIWLARSGWQVTAVDPSGVALARAQLAAGDAQVEITWVHAGLLTMPGGTGTHDLVSAQYAVVRDGGDAAAIRALLGAVAPGGTLLVVHHDLEHHDHHQNHEQHAAAHGFDPADHLVPADVAAHLDDGWEVAFHGVRPRAEPVPTDARHIHDVVLRARRLPR